MTRALLYLGSIGDRAKMRMEAIGLNCRICGGPVDPRRVELGYDYCLKERCQQLGVKRVELASVGVNKAADYYTTADELVPPRLPAPKTEALEESSDVAGSPGRPAVKPDARDPHRPPTTLERLRKLETELDRALEASYQRFERGEITAADMDRDRDRLTAAFNQVVRAENIRYRSMLRAGRSRSR